MTTICFTVSPYWLVKVMKMLALCESLFLSYLALSALCLPMQSAFEANAQKVTCQMLGIDIHANAGIAC